ncbi:MAG: UTP--glucose-1-phosphate uridylyltransferase GalU [Erysipelotrichales bacterium]
MNKKVRKAVIPAAGLGTRFLPATKSIPKEMLPIVDVPTIQIIIEEAVASGIEEILIITSPSKHAMENHFDYSYELEHRLLESNKQEEAKMIKDIANMANIHYIRQKEPKGLGHAINCARTFVGDEPFAILLGDDIVVNDTKPALAQLINAYEETGYSILGVQSVDKNQVSKYGVIDPIDALDENNLCELKGMVEKPAIDEAPSNLAAMGRYVLTSDIFDILDKQEPGKGNEIQLTDAIEKLMHTSKVYACNFSGTRYDVGDKLGFVKATIDFALKKPELKEDLISYINEIIKE